jgi:hypothetical protein
MYVPRVIQEEYTKPHGYNEVILIKKILTWVQFGKFKELTAV